MYICQSQSPNSSHRHPFPSLVFICLFSTSVSLFLPCKVHLYHFLRFHIYALIYDICFSLSDLLHSVWQSLGPSTSLQMTQSRSLFLSEDLGRFQIYADWLLPSLLCSAGSSYWVISVKRSKTQLSVASVHDLSCSEDDCDAGSQLCPFQHIKNGERMCFVLLPPRRFHPQEMIYSHSTWSGLNCVSQKILGLSPDLWIWTFLEIGSLQMKLSCSY